MFTLKGFWRVLFRAWLDGFPGLRTVPGRLFLLLFTVLGACHVAPVHAKHSVAPLYAVKHNDFLHFLLRDAPEPPMATPASQMPLRELPETSQRPPRGLPESNLI